MKNLIYILTIFLALLSCKTERKQDAQSIIDKAIEVAGGKTFEASTISFDFREKHYQAIRSSGVFQFERQFEDSLGVIRDVLSNDGFKRFVDEKPFMVHDSMAAKYSRSVNSVHYFSVLPYGLNDEAVNKTLIGEVSINTKEYYKIKVHFNEDGGGDDFEDLFVYWIGKNDFKVDYMAYSYRDNETEFGSRFREAYNERYVEGIRFVDYKNYKPKSKDIDLTQLPQLFENGELELLSKIETENIAVNQQQ